MKTLNNTLLILIAFSLIGCDDKDYYTVSFDERQAHKVNQEKLESYIEGRYRGDSDDYVLIQWTMLESGMFEVVYSKDGTEHKDRFDSKYMTAYGSWN